MRTIMARILIGLLALSIGSAALSCSVDPSSWYPSGTATIASFFESPESGGCQVTLRIANLGKSSINSYCVSIGAVTTMRTYYRTICGELCILPGGSAYASTQISYATGSESLAPGGLSIVDAFFQ